MNKLLSFALVMVMLVGAVTLSGCNETPDTPLDTPSEITSNITISEEEWNAILKYNNYSATCQVLDFMGNVTTSGRAATDGKNMYLYAKNSIIVLDIYSTTIDNIQYLIFKEDSGYVAYTNDDKFNAPTVGRLLAGVSRSDLLYDEKSKSYKYKDPDIIIEIVFENGNLKSFTRTKISTNTTYTLFNFGTTVVELPEFTFKSTDN